MTPSVTIPRSAGALCLLIAGCAVDGSEGRSPISTDRPGFLFAPTVVPAERFQVEAGLPFVDIAQSGGDETRVMSALVALRYGLDGDVELRASLPTGTLERAEVDGEVERTEGFGDTEVGAKFALPALGSSPLALLVSLRLPTGADRLSTGEVGGSAFLITGRDLESGLWLQGMVGLTHTPVDGAEDQSSGIIAGLASHPIGPRTSAYAEFAIVPGISNARGLSFAGVGLTWTPVDHVQFDCSADFGLEDDASDALLGLGVSWFL